jgi:hypothetical protein
MKTISLVIVIIVGTASVDGCASGSPPSSAAAASLCQNVSRVDRLDAKRTDALPQNRSLFSFPADISTADANSDSDCSTIAVRASGNAHDSHRLPG